VRIRFLCSWKPSRWSQRVRQPLELCQQLPVTSIRAGIDVIAPHLWNGAKPELALTGPNVGSNLAIQTHFSGTVGAATYVAKTAKIPAIAFSGRSGRANGMERPDTAVQQSLCRPRAERDHYHHQQWTTIPAQQHIPERELRRKSTRTDATAQACSNTSSHASTPTCVFSAVTTLNGVKTSICHRIHSLFSIAMHAM
jgi:hypothetical protein